MPRRASSETPGPLSPAALKPNRADLAQLVRLALPVAAVQVGMMAMGAVDTVMVGRVSPADLAAVVDALLAAGD